MGKALAMPVWPLGFEPQKPLRELRGVASWIYFPEAAPLKFHLGSFAFHILERTLVIPWRLIAFGIFNKAWNVSFKTEASHLGVFEGLYCFVCLLFVFLLMFLFVFKGLIM